MQRQTDHTQSVKIKKQIDYDYAVGGKVLILKDGILCKAESPKQKKHGQSW